MNEKKLKIINESIKEIEDAGGIVMFEDSIDEKLQKLNEKELVKEKLKEEKLKKRNESYFKPISIDSYMDDPSMLMDSIVDACCSQGCVCEPDGHCIHGHPSVLLYHGLI